ncbi:MAG: hypothetical protein AAFZ38_02940 [Myxococcota bacterium]
MKTSDVVVTLMGKQRLDRARNPCSSPIRVDETTFAEVAHELLPWTESTDT